MIFRSGLHIRVLIYLYNVHVNICRVEVTLYANGAYRNVTFNEVNRLIFNSLKKENAFEDLNNFLPFFWGTLKLHVLELTN